MIHAGEIKSVQILVNAQPPKPRPVHVVSLTNSTGGTLKVKLSGGATRAIAVTPVAIDPDPMNHYVLFTTSADDFPEAGSYTVQLFVTFDNADDVESDETIWKIGRSL